MDWYGSCSIKDSQEHVQKLIRNCERASFYVLLHFQASHVRSFQCGTKEDKESTINCLANYQDISLTRAHKELKENQRNRTWGAENLRRMEDYTWTFKGNGGSWSQRLSSSRRSNKLLAEHEEEKGSKYSSCFMDITVIKTHLHEFPSQCWMLK